MQWFGTAMKPPGGRFSTPSHFLAIRTFINGRARPASSMNVARLLADSFKGAPPLLGGGDIEIGAQAGQLLGKALVTAVDDVDARNA